MCIDFTNLNKVYPKDSYPLPKINHLVDAMEGFEFLSSLDVYSGYHQILMHLEDEEKTAFIIEFSIYCYKVMQLGLKNARATYQQIINRIFKNQLGRIIEGYIDDMLVKSMTFK
jgi:uncharacterized membrane protein YkvI